jgi:DNA-binding transcriptional regulator YiaG
MGKVEDALRSLIQYHGRRAARDVMGNLPEQVREVSREVRELSRAVEKLQENVATLLDARYQRMDVPPAPEEEVSGSRVTSRTLRSIRRRFDLTQEELAEVLDVATPTISLWETGSSKPRTENAARIITLRGMGKGEVDEILGREPEEPDIPAPAGQEIKDLRKRLDLSQHELADLLDVAAGTVAHWETDRSAPGPENRQALKELQSRDREEVDEELGRAMSEGEERPGEEEEPSELTPERIKAIRARLELTQAELGEKLGVTGASVWNWEAGNTKPRKKTRRKLLELA